MGMESANREPSQSSPLTDVCGVCRMSCGRNRRMSIRVVRRLDENLCNETPTGFTPNIRITKVPSVVPRGAHYGAIQLASKRFVLHQSAMNGHQTGHLWVVKKQNGNPDRVGVYVVISSVLPSGMKRNGRNSNPGYPHGYSGFQDRCNRPLCHLSGCGFAGGILWD